VPGRPGGRNYRKYNVFAFFCGAVLLLTGKLFEILLEFRNKLFIEAVNLPGQL
jgi:hypothetical protein